MKWGDFIARTAVRRVVYVLVAVVLAWAGIGRAEAQQTCGGGTYCSTREEAWQQCSAYLPTRADRYNKDCRWTSQTGGGRYTAWGATSEGGTPAPLFAFQYRDPECPANTTWDEASKTCHNPSECLARPDLGAMTISGSGTTACSDGCAFQPSGTSLTLGSDAAVGAMTYGSSWSPTGAACTVGESTPAPNTDPQQCKQAPNGQTYCLKSNGDHCYSASTGRQICWKPGETGEKNDGDIRQGRSPGESPISPQPIPGDTLTPTGDPITTTTTTGTGRTITTTIQNYTTGSGADAGKGGQGESATGEGSGDGDGDGDGEEDGPGQPGEGVGDLYESSGKTIDGVIGEFRSKVMQSPLIGAAAGFMGNCAFSGQCPVWTYDGGEYMGTLTFDALCNGALQGLLSYGGYIVIALAAFAAFRIGIY